MAEDDQRNAPEGDDEPQIRVPSHDPLPPPPEIHYTRPTLGKKPASQGTNPVDYGSGGGSPLTVSASGNYARGLAGGISLAGCIIAGYWLGSMIDAHWIRAQMPWGTIVMTLAGVFTGFYNLFRMVNRNYGKKQ